MNRHLALFISENTFSTPHLAIRQLLSREESRIFENFPNILDPSRHHDLGISTQKSPSKVKFSEDANVSFNLDRALRLTIVCFQLFPIPLWQARDRRASIIKQPPGLAQALEPHRQFD